MGVPRQIRSRLSLDQARAILAGRIENRERDLVASVRDNIYRYPRSPYLPLLRHAGVEEGDFAALVDREGVEGALHRLMAQGVYLTMDELRGRRAVTRGSLTFTCSAAGFRNPARLAAYQSQTSGSNGQAAPTPIALRYVNDRMVDQLIGLSARGGANWETAFWRVPGSTLAHMLSFTAIGARPRRWFSPVDPRQQGLHPRYWWSARLVSLAAAAAGNPFPMPQYVPPADPGPILQWLRQVLGRGRRPRIMTFASLGVRLSLAAQAEGLDLTGAEFCLGGEPTTAARLAAVRASGADAVPIYGAAEAGSLGWGCALPMAADDMHLLTDLVAHIQPGGGHEALGLPERALLMTSLRADSGLILLNLAIGDEAIVEPRDCGCLLDEVGWKVHIHHLRSYEKLSAAGMTFLDSRVVEILDEVLPGAFGGRPTDYQLVEAEAPSGLPLLILRIHPSVGEADVDRVKQVLFDSLNVDSGLGRIMSTMLRTGAVLEIERTAPLMGATGKILHLYHGAGP